MGHNWTYEGLSHAFAGQETLEYFADSQPFFFPEPVWIPCIMSMMSPAFTQEGQLTVRVQVCLLPSRYADVTRLLGLEKAWDIAGLDQIRNRLRPRENAEVIEHEPRTP